MTAAVHSYEDSSNNNDDMLLEPTPITNPRTVFIVDVMPIASFSYKHTTGGKRIELMKTE